MLEKRCLMKDKTLEIITLIFEKWQNNHINIEEEVKKCLLENNIEYLTPMDIAEMLLLNERDVYNMILKGEIIAYIIGTNVSKPVCLISANSFDDYLNNHPEVVRRVELENAY